MDKKELLAIFLCKSVKLIETELFRLLKKWKKNDSQRHTKG